MRELCLHDLALSLTQHSAAFEIADDLLRCSDFQWQGLVPLREHTSFLMLLAHSSPDMLLHSSRAIAAAAILTSLRLQAGPAAAASAAAQLPPAVAADGVVACAAAMWAMREAADGEPGRPRPGLSGGGGVGARAEHRADRARRLALPCPHRSSESRTGLLLE